MGIDNSLGDAFMIHNSAGGVDSSSQLTIATDGDIGIGTVSPDEKLHVSNGKVLIDVTSSVGTELIFKNLAADQFAADKNYHEINFITSATSSETTGGYVRIKAGQEVSGTDNKSYLGFWTAPDDGTVTEKMRIDSDGNVGIGTTSPDYDLDVERVATAINDDPTIRVRNSWATEGNNTGFSNRAAGLYSAGADTVVTKIQSRFDTGFNLGEVGTTTNHDFRFITNNVERIRIDSSGNVSMNSVNRAINTPGNLFVSTTDTLGINKGAQISLGGVWAGTSQIQFAAIAGRKENSTSGSAGGYLQFSTSLNAGGSTTEKMRISNDGKVGIGTENASGMLHIKGDSNSRGAEVYLQVNNNNTTDILGSINFGNNVDETITVIESNTADNNRTSLLSFFTSYEGVLKLRMKLPQTNGNGSAPLQVSGAQVTTMYNTPRVKTLGHPGNASPFTRTINPVTEFGQLRSGGQVAIQVAGWQGRLINGFIFWRNNGGSDPISVVNN